MLSKRQLMILGGVGVFALFLIVAVVIGWRPWGVSTKLTVWGVFDDPEAYRAIFREFSQTRGISASFVKKDITTYETELVNALAAGRGPDVFMINNAWLPKHFDKLWPAPDSLITPAKVRDIFPDVVSADFVAGGKVWALPLSVDTLALFYNRQLFNQASIALPPSTWEEVIADVPKLTKVDQLGIIQQSAIALGTSANINRASDILAALMLQSGSSIVDRKNLEASFHWSEGGERPAGEQALAFYLQFADPSKSVYTWESDQHYSIDAFSEGTLAMMLNYSYQIPVIRAKGPFIDFAVSFLPQPASRGDRRVDYANYWGFAVSNQSRHRREAWELIAFMTSKEQAAKYLAATGRPPARRDLIQSALDRPTVGIFARQALTAVSWFQPDATQVESIFRAMIDAARRGEAIGTVVSRAKDQINLLLAKYRQQSEFWQ
jgi:multiple sugar transport system substrate-binding protein